MCIQQTHHYRHFLRFEDDYDDQRLRIYLVDYTPCTLV